MHDSLEFGRQHFSFDTLTNAAQAVLPATQDGRARSIHIAGGAADEIVVFRRPSAGAEYFRMKVPLGQPAYLEGVYFEAGLEVLTANAAGDVGITIILSSPGL